MIGKITAKLLGGLFSEPAVPMGMKHLENRQSIVNVTNFSAEDLVIDDSLAGDLLSAGSGPNFIEQEIPLTAGLMPDEIPLFEQLRKKDEKELVYETKEKRELRYKMDALKRELEIDELSYEMRMRL
jgi:hypothetical protein